MKTTPTSPWHLFTELTPSPEELAGGIELAAPKTKQRTTQYVIPSTTSQVIYTHWRPLNLPAVPTFVRPAHEVEDEAAYRLYLEDANDCYNQYRLHGFNGGRASVRKELRASLGALTADIINSEKPSFGPSWQSLFNKVLELIK